MGSADAHADGAAGVTRKGLDWPRLIVMTVGLTLINTWSDIIARPGLRGLGRAVRRHR